MQARGMNGTRIFGELEVWVPHPSLGLCHSKRHLATPSFGDTNMGASHFRRDGLLRCPQVRRLPCPLVQECELR
jgi:hypothetical protein